MNQLALQRVLQSEEAAHSQEVTGSKHCKARQMGGLKTSPSWQNDKNDTHLFSGVLNVKSQFWVKDQPSRLDQKTGSSLFLLLRNTPHHQCLTDATLGLENRKGYWKQMDCKMSGEIDLESLEYTLWVLYFWDVRISSLSNAVGSSASL